jgi:cyclase
VRKVIKRIALGLGVLLVVAAIVVGVRVFQFFRVSGQKLDEKFHVWSGGGGNTAVLVTNEGSVIVDTKIWLGASRLHDEVEKLGKVRAIVNTHHHLDHTHGNPLFAPGTAVHASEGMSALLSRFDADFWAEEPAKSLAPNRRFRGVVEIDLGEETLRLVELPASHTGGGDIAVLFVKRRIVHTGDIVFNGLYPSIDVESGGSVSGCVAAADAILALPFDTAIPGHGPVGGRADVEAMRNYFVALRDHGKAAVAAGWSAHEAEKRAPPELRNREPISGITSLAKNIEAAMLDATGR